MWRRGGGREREEERGRGGNRGKNKATSHRKEKGLTGAPAGRTRVQVSGSLSPEIRRAGQGPSHGDLRSHRCDPNRGLGTSSGSPEGLGLDPSEVGRQGKQWGSAGCAWRLPERWRAWLRPQNALSAYTHTLEYIQHKSHHLHPKQEEPKSPRRSPEATATIDCA